MNHHSFKNLLLMQYSMFMLAIYAIYCSVYVNPMLLIYPLCPISSLVTIGLFLISVNLLLFCK